MVTKKLKGYLRIYTNTGEKVLLDHNVNYVTQYTSKQKLIEDVAISFDDCLDDNVWEEDVLGFKDIESFTESMRKRVPELWSSNDLIVDLATGEIVEPLSFGLEKILKQVTARLWADALPERERLMKQRKEKKVKLQQQLHSLNEEVKKVTAQLKELDKDD